MRPRSSMPVEILFLEREGATNATFRPRRFSPTAPAVATSKSSRAPVEPCYPGSLLEVQTYFTLLSWQFTEFQMNTVFRFQHAKFDLEMALEANLLRIHNICMYYFECIADLGQYRPRSMFLDCAPRTRPHVSVLCTRTHRGG